MANLKPTHALNLDINSQKNFIKFYNGLGEKPSTTVRLFDRTDYYTVHGSEDTEMVAKIVFRSTANIKTMSPGDALELTYISLSKGNFELAVRELLLVKNFRVEVFTNKKGTKTTDWAIEFKGSPGNLLQFEDLLFGNNDMIVGSAIVAINLRQEGSQRLVGLACVECNDCLMSITEFLDDDFFAELEATVVLLGPKECVLPASDGDYDRIKTLMERNGVMVTILKKKDFVLEKSDLVQDLNNLLRFKKGQQEDANALPEMSKTLAITSLGAAIKYLSLPDDPANLKNYQLRLLNLNRFVHLDAAAVSALNIIPRPGTQINTPAYRWQSVLGVLDRCRTAQGHRLMAQWIKQPLRSEEILNDRHNIVQCFLESPTALRDLHDEQLKRIPDVMMLTKRLMRKKGALQDIFRVYQVIIRTPRLVSILADLENTSIQNVLCIPLKDTLDDLKMLKQMVEQVVDLDGIQQGEYFVKASFDAQLEEMREKMDSMQTKMERQLDKVSADLELEKGSTLKLEYVSHLGNHFRISLKDDAVLRKNNKYKILDAIKGGVRFTTDKLAEYNQDSIEVRQAYEEHQKSIVDEVIRVAIGYLGPLTSLNNHVAQIDCLVSFAVAAQSAPIPYIRPTILPEGSGMLKLKNLRHPCLELQENVTYIANDVDFEKDKSSMYIITGPNMGGKSTFIRSVGTAVLMAHVGSFVPCDEATISMVDSILGRVGAGDNITKGLSTFMVEMIETSAIIRTATNKSLVIIDELGRGTSTYDGCGIAWSIAEHLSKETGCFTLFATHFHEITELASYFPTVKNYHMAAVADKDNFTLLYQVKPGVIDKSFGIQVAKLADFPDNVVKLAQERFDELEDHFTNLITDEDQEIVRTVEEAVEKLLAGNGTLSDAEMEKIITDSQQKVRSSDSPYFKRTFPALFDV